MYEEQDSHAVSKCHCRGSLFTKVGGGGSFPIRNLMNPGLTKSSTLASLIPRVFLCVARPRTYYFQVFPTESTHPEPNPEETDKSRM